MGVKTETLVKRYIELNEKKKKLNADLKEVNGAMTEHETVILDRWATDTISKQTMGGFTVHLRNDVQAKTSEGFNGGDVADALRKAKLGFLVTANWQSLKAWVKERKELKKPIPAGVSKVLTIIEITKLGVRKA